RRRRMNKQPFWLFAPWVAFAPDAIGGTTLSKQHYYGGYSGGYNGETELRAAIRRELEAEYLQERRQARERVEHESDSNILEPRATAASIRAISADIEKGLPVTACTSRETPGDGKSLTQTIRELMAQAGLSEQGMAAAAGLPMEDENVADYQGSARPDTGK